MKRNDIKKLAEKTVAELNKELQTALLDLAGKRQEKKAGRLANPTLVSHLADDIARIKTVLRQKEMVVTE